MSPSSEQSVVRWLLIACVAVSACTTGGTVASHNSSDTPTPEKSLLQRGVGEMQAGRVDEARAYFRQVLKYDPQNAKAHLALATTFDADALGGDTPKRDLAEVGYSQALHFDERNWLAAYRLGVLESESGRYTESINHLARAAILNRREPEIFSALAHVLYLDSRFADAQAVAERALVSMPSNAPLLRTAAIVAAANGDTASVATWSAQFARVARDPGAVAELRQRLDDWSFEHQRETRRVDSGSVSSQRAALADSVPPGMPPATRSPFLVAGETEAKSTMLHPLPPLPAGAKARMVQIDLLLIRTQEIETNNRGVNLLSGLRANFAIGRDNSTARAEAADGITTQTGSSTVLRSLKIPEIQYSLDIANTGYDRSDVLARPLLVALDGQPANYFVGEQLSIPVNAIGGGLAPGTLIDKNIGTEIAITPTFIDDNTILLNVSATRSFIATNAVPIANTAVRQTIQRVTTAVVADFDQTVILSGLSEHESRSIKTGVPLLQEIPGVQYLFSTKSEQLFETSVLMVLSPRRVGQTQPASTPGAGTIEVVGLGQLQEYFPELDKRITILKQLSRTLQHNTFKKLLSREDDVTSQQRQSRDEFARRVGNQMKNLFYF